MTSCIRQTDSLLLKNKTARLPTYSCTYLLRSMSLPSSWASISCLITSPIVNSISSAGLRSPVKILTAAKVSSTFFTFIYLFICMYICNTYAYTWACACNFKNRGQELVLSSHCMGSWLIKLGGKCPYHRAILPALSEDLTILLSNFPSKIISRTAQGHLILK